MCYREYAHCKFCRHTVRRVTRCLSYEILRTLMARGIYKQVSEEETVAKCPRLVNGVYYFAKGHCPKYNMGCDSWYLNMNIWHPSVQNTGWALPERPDKDQDMTWAYEDPEEISAENLPTTFDVVRGNPSLF